MEIRGALRGVEIRVTAIDTDVMLRCDDACRAKDDCPLRRLCSRSGDAEMRITRVSLEIANRAANAFSPQSDAWELVDAQGYSVGGAAVCESLLPAGFVQADLWSVTPQTRVRTMLAFPADAAPLELIYADGEACLRLRLEGGWLPAQRRREKLKGRASIRLKKRGSIRITQCWSVKNSQGRREYIFIGKQ